MPTLCQEEGCTKQAMFALPENSAIYCSSHKNEGMVNVRIKRCEHNREKSKCKECGGSQICEHNRIRSSCRECGGSSICEHNRKKSTCRECGGSSICEHNKRRTICKECGGGQICEHSRIKSTCKECGGGQICEHNKRKSQCKECGGPAFCEHNKVKTRCKECGGSEICEHSRLKFQCKECGGSAICEHNRRKTTCKDCKGGAICEHNRVKISCRECGGSQICEHNRQKVRCKECGGSAICEHNIQRARCKECGGSQICEHNKQKARCKECGGSQICKHNKIKESCKDCGGSKLCKTPLCETRGNLKYDKYCLTCFIHLFPDRPNSRNYKTKERAVVESVQTKFPNFTWRDDKRIQDGCSKRRPDLLLDLGYQVIIVEVDENQHTNYDCSCENKRLMELSLDVGHRPIVFIRFNPDDYKAKDGNVTSCWGYDGRGLAVVKKTKKKEWTARLEALRTQIEYWSKEENKTNKTVEIVQLYYDEVDATEVEEDSKEVEEESKEDS